MLKHVRVPFFVGILDNSIDFSSSTQPALKSLILFIVEIVFSGKILTEEKSATETVGTGTQEGRHNDHFGLISDIYRNHEMIVSIQCVSSANIFLFYS